VTWKSPLSAKFSTISRSLFHLPLLGFACVVSDAGDSLWRELERSKSLVLQVGGLTCHWQQHSVKTFLVRIFNDSWADRNPQGLQSRLKKNSCGVKYVPVYATKAYRPSRNITLPILSLESKWIDKWTSCPGRFTPGKELRWLLKRRLGGFQRRSGWFWNT